MFDNLSERLGQALQRWRGTGRITEENVRDSLREIRMALLEADAALPVVKSFVETVRARALGTEVLRSVTPGQTLVGIVHQALTETLGGDAAPLNLAKPPAVILLAGLQGSGKTTTTAKLARWLKAHGSRRVLVASTDLYRPAAIEQLARLAAEVEVDFFHSDSADAVAVARTALEEARRRLYDVLLVDTAGRLHVDAAMMDEIRRIHQALVPAETLFIVDCMAGQDAARAAAAFAAAVPLTGTILTKVDGDARGGAALSVRQATAAPIKFMGTGERPAALEAFHPDRLASRILGMGDVVSLVEEARQKVNQVEAERLTRKLKQGGFDLADFRDQMVQMLSMGGIGALLEKLPGAGALPPGVRDLAQDRDIRRQIAIIDSMTPRERRHPGIINGSRRRRIARGSGNDVQHVNRLLKQFSQMQKWMKKASRGGMANLLRGISRGLPPGPRRR